MFYVSCKLYLAHESLMRERKQQWLKYMMTLKASAQK